MNHVLDCEIKTSSAVERMTRMGRRYGLGISIATRRVAYLNATAIPNCHTVSVLFFR